MALLLLILQVALIAFIVVGTVALISRGVRRSRAHRSDPRWNGHSAQPGHEATARGAMPNTQLPEWAYWDGDNPESGARDRPVVGA
jgi:hypothetical protein